MQDKRPYFMEVLLDKDNHAPLFLVNKEGEKFVFNKLYVDTILSNNNPNLYCILQICQDTEGANKGDIFIYHVTEDNLGNVSLHMETNQTICRKIQNAYDSKKEDE